VVKIGDNTSNTKKYHGNVKEIIIVLMNIFYNKRIPYEYTRQNKCEEKIKEKALNFIEHKYFAIHKNNHCDGKKIRKIIFKFLMHVILKSGSNKK